MEAGRGGGRIEIEKVYNRSEIGRRFVCSGTYVTGRWVRIFLSLQSRFSPGKRIILYIDYVEVGTRRLPL